MRDRLTPEDVDRVLSEAGTGDRRLGPLSAFVRDVRLNLDGAPSPELRDRHLRAMAEAFVPGGARASVRRRVVARPTPRRIAFAAACFVGAAAALAFAGSLGPAQDFVANAVRVTGLDLPGGSGDPEKGGHDAPQGEAGKLRAADNRAEAEAFTDAKKEWTSCVAEKAQAFTGPGEFDPEAEPPAGCGAKPGPQEFRIDDDEATVRTPNPAGHVPGSGGGDDDVDLTGAPEVPGQQGQGPKTGPDAPGRSGEHGPGSGD